MKTSAAVVVSLQMMLLSMPLGASAEEPLPSPGEAPAQEQASILEKLNEKIPIELSGYMWVDTGYMARDNALAGSPDQNANYMQGRFVLAGTFERPFGELYGKAKLELVGFDNEYTKSQYEPHTLDAYLQFGTKKFDVQLGRFLAWEVYQRGQGIELYTAEEAGALGGSKIYLLDFNWGHMNEVGQAALHYYPFDFLGFELAGVYGQEGAGLVNYAGVRPVADFRLGGLQVVGGFEYQRQYPQTTSDKTDITSMGFAGRAQYTLGPVTLGVNYSRADVEHINHEQLVDTDKSAVRTSMGSFLDLDFWKNSIGLGYHRTTEFNQQSELHTHDQAFVSYLYRLPIQGLSVKGVYGFAKAHRQDNDNDSEWDNYLQSFRLRVAYQFH
jgi:hypothetical protein